MSHHDVAPRPAESRRGAFLLLTLLLCTLALLVAVTARAAGAEDLPLPEKTSSHLGGLPPYGPPTWDDDPKRQAWCDAALDVASKDGATRHAADLIFSVTEVYRRQGRTWKSAAQLYAEAAAIYDPSDITRGVLLVRWFRLEVDRGNQPEAARVLAALQDYVDRRTPRDVEEQEAVRWETWEIERRRDLPQHVARHHEANGRYREAAEIREQLAREEADLFDRSRRARLYESAARAYHRAGMKDGALRAIDAAIELVDDETRKAHLRFWRLYAKHGLLSPEGFPLVTDRWPGDAFEDDVRTFLREIQGVEGVGTKYLALGSRAHAAKRYEIALDIYLLALRDPSLVTEARKDASIWRGLLMGYSAAMELERFDEAEQILEIVERVADEPIADKDDYVVAVAKARQWAADRPMREEARRKLAEAKKKRAKRESRLRRARMETGEGGGAEDEPGDGAAGEKVAGEEASDTDVPFLLVFAVLLALYVLVVALIRRARR